MVNQELRDVIAESNEDAIVFDNPSFDNSIIGMTTDGCVIYSMNLMIKELAEEDNISEEEAYEFIDYNTLRAMPYAGEYAPVVLDQDPVFYEVLNNINRIIDGE